MTGFVPAYLKGWEQIVKKPEGMLHHLILFCEYAKNAPIIMTIDAISKLAPIFSNKSPKTPAANGPIV